MKTITLFIILLSPLFIYSQTFDEIKKSVSLHRASSADYGFSVSIDGNFAVVGSRSDKFDVDSLNNMGNAGAAYILGKDEGGTNNWGIMQKIVACDRDPGAFFGHSVSISGNYVVVGAKQEDHAGCNFNSSKTDAGAVYIYKYDTCTGVFTFLKKLVASDRTAADHFGWSVDLDGEKLIVGAYTQDKDQNGGNTISNAGAAYIFYKYQGGTDNWGQVRKVVSSDRGGGDYFGHSVSISGDYAIVGALEEDHDASGGNTLSSSGSAYLFYIDEGGSNNWGQIQKITAFVRNSGDHFGSGVGISGDYAIVGAYLEDEDASESSTVNNAGSAYIFKRDTNTVDTWNGLKKIVGIHRSNSDQFGFTVAISGEKAVVGANFEDSDENGGSSLTNAGSAFIYCKNNGGTDNWGLSQKIVASDRSSTDRFSHGIDISGDYIISGAYQHNLDENGGNSISDAGAAYIFEYNPSSPLIYYPGTNQVGLTPKIFADDEPVFFPNPVTNDLNVILPEGRKVKSIRVYDMKGRPLITTNDNFSISLSLLSAGLYTVTLQTMDGLHFQKKIVKR